MRKITSSSQLLQLLKRDKVVIRVLPYGGIQLVKKYCKDCISVPNEFKDTKELQNWIDFMKSKDNYKIIGRSYVIDLFTGKTQLGKGDLTARGNVITVPIYTAINYVSKKGAKNVNKILDYSFLTLRGYGTFIPALLREGVKLEKENKLDESLNTFNKFRKILLLRENEASSPKELLKKVYMGKNLREDWERLSTIWKEIIYYLIDSSLGLLPGESKRELEDLENISTEEVAVSPIDYPDYVDIVNIALAELSRGNNVAIEGNIKTGKSTISELIKRRASELKVNVNIVDYHDLSGKYNSIEKFVSASSSTLYVLAHDLYLALRPKAFRVNVDSRFIYAVSRNKGLTLRLDEKVFSIPVHYIIMHQKDNIEDTITSALEHFYRDFWEYVYNVIFDGDPNKVLWYLPLLAVYDKYTTPIPEKIGALILKNTNRKGVDENDIVLRWFSKCNIIYKPIRSEEYGTDTIDKIDIDNIIKKTASDIAKEIKSVDDIIDLYPYLFMNKLEERVNINSEELKNFFDNNISFMKILLPDILDNLKDRIDVSKYCRDLLDSSLPPYKLLARIKVVLMRGSNSECTSLALNYLSTIAKSGKEEWIRLVLDDFLNNSSIIEVDPYKLSVILYYYLMHSPDNLEKIKTIFRTIEGKTKYSVFVKSLINYIEGNIDEVQVSDPLWAVLIYGSLGVYSLMNHDLLKLAFVYDKFRKSYLTVKNLKGQLSTDPNLKDFFPINNGVLDYIDELKDRLDAGIGYTLLLTHPREESARATIELVEKLIMNWYDRIRNRLKEGKIKDNEIMDLLQIYQIRLMKSLLSGGKYEYKSVLRDIMELEELGKYVKEQDVKGSLSIASAISRKILGNEQRVETVSGTTLDLLIYMASEIILGAEDKGKFFDFISGQIKNKEEGLDKALVGIISAFIKNDKKELESAIEYARENYYSVMLEILTKYINDKKMFVVSLIPYIGIWHFLGG